MATDKFAGRVEDLTWLYTLNERPVITEPAPSETNEDTE